MEWLTGDDVDKARAFWPTVDEVPPEDLPALLDTAREQCEAFAPSLGDPRYHETYRTTYTNPTPTRYQAAQVLQARALYRAGLAGSGDQTGLDGMTVTLFPMDWTVKNLLRPQTRPVIA